MTEPAAWVRVKVLRLRGKRGRPWVCRWRGGGRWCQRAIPRRHAASAPARERFRAALEDRVNAFEGPDAADVRIGLESAIAEFLDSRAQRGARPDTAKVYRHVLAPLGRRCRGRRLADLTARDLERHLSAPSWAPATRWKHYAHLRTFFRWAVRRGYVRASPLDALEPPPKARPRPFAFAPPQAAALLAEVGKRRPWVQAAVRLALLCGLRVGELSTLSAVHVNAAARLLLIPAQKSARDRLVMFDEETGGLLQELAWRGDHLLWGPPDAPIISDRLFRRRLWEEVRGLYTALGLPQPRRPMQALRRTFGTALGSASVSSLVMGDVMGHRSLATLRDFYFGAEGAASARAAFDAVRRQFGSAGDLAGDPARGPEGDRGGGSCA